MGYLLYRFLSAGVELSWRTPVTVVTALVSAVVYFFGSLWLERTASRWQPLP